MGNLFCLVSYPKSGNTWLRAFLTNYLRDADKPAGINALDVISPVTDRELFDELIGIEASDLRLKEIELYYPQFIRGIARSDALIFSKVHNAYTRNAKGEPLFPKDSLRGVIYIVRNPLDIVSSYAHHAGKTIDEIIEFMASDASGFGFMNGKITEKLPERLLNWSDHASSWLDEPDLNLYIVRYEDLLTDPLKEFTAVIDFIGLDRDAARIRKAVDFSTFEQFQAQEKEHGFAEKHPPAPSFFRQGRAGSWQRELTEAQVLRIIREHRRMMARFGYAGAEKSPGT